MNPIDLSGTWHCEIPGQKGTAALPGTLDENGFGSADDPARQWNAEAVQRMGFWREGEPIVTRLTRKHAFEGEARFSRRLDWTPPTGRRFFISCERARKLRLLVNGREARPAEDGCLSAPWTFEVTELVTGRDELVFLSDNSYPGWPRDAIVYSSAASDETQTNWNGLLGDLRLYAEETNFLSAVRVYPRGNCVDVALDMDLGEDWAGVVRIASQALRDGEAVFSCGPLSAGRRELRFSGLPLSPDAPRWDLEEGNLCDLTVIPEGMESRTARFGVRDFGAAEGCLTLNGRRVFLRGETNCCVFPETGYPPMDAEAWKAVFLQYRAYGVNCVRFHSHCPPEAAFQAADEMGMLMQPELSHWDPAHAFASAEARAYYPAEARRVVRLLANHPSFVMLTLGNELHADEAGRAFMGELLRELRQIDPTRLYANGSNPHYGALGPDPDSDFFTASDDRERPLRGASAYFKGWMNRADAGASPDYGAELAEIRKVSGQPVFSFEVGQYETLPDFGQIADFRGVTSPENLRLMEKRMRDAGLAEEWRRRVSATGECALQCYRAEVEAAMRTAGFSGIFLLGLQDFPGQGTALVGMTDAHLRPKPSPFARPERFAAFFRDTLPLALLPRYTFTAGETLRVPVRISHYGKRGLTGSLKWRLSGPDFFQAGQGEEKRVPAGSLTDVGCVMAELAGIERAVQLTLKISFCDQENVYPLWVYPDAAAVCPENVYECRALDKKARETLAAGGRVYLAPDSTEQVLPRSVQAQFSPDFWSVCTFPEQSGCMGQLIDADHPLFREFPTDRFNTWQWRPMAGSRVLLLPRPMRAIIAEMDACVTSRPMAKLLECRCGGGRLLISSLGLHGLTRFPEARALQKAVYDYLASDVFQPDQEMTLETARMFLPFG